MQWKRILLCLLSSSLLVLSFPNFNFSFLAWFALIPLLFAIKNSSTKQAFFLGLLTGFFAYLGLLYWIITVIVSSGESLLLGILCLFLLSFYLSLYFALFSLLLNFIIHNSSFIIVPFISASLWASLEYIRSHLFTGFPWALLGYSQWNFLPIIQISEFTGVYGVSFLIVLVNTVLAGLWDVGSGKWGKIKTLLPTIVVFLVCLSYGLFHLPTRELVNSSTPFKVSLLQGNIDQYKKWSKEYEKEIMDKYTQLVQEAAKEKPDLIVWPESAIPGYLLYERHLFDWVRKLILESECSHVIGSVHLREGNFRPFATAQGETFTSSTVSLYNSVFLFSPRTRFLGEYDKVHLVPFGESIPLKDFLSKYIKVLNELGDFSPGKDFTVFHFLPINLSTYQPINAVTFGVNICFESIFPHLIRKFVKNGAEVLVNLTNDAWFLKTSAPYQHFTMNVFRAVENRRYLVRCANTGISGIIDPSGRIVRETPIFVTSYLTGKIYFSDKKTFYTRYGDLFALICLSILIVNLFLPVTRSRQLH